MPMANDPVQLVYIFLLALHLDLLDRQLPLHLDFVVELLLDVLVGLETIEVELYYRRLTMSMLGHSLRYRVC